MAAMQNVEVWPDALDALHAAPLPPHTLENVGESELRVISVEVKSPV